MNMPFKVGDIVVPKHDRPVESREGTFVAGTNFNVVRQAHERKDTPEILLTCTDKKLRWFDAGFFKMAPN